MVYEGEVSQFAEKWPTMDSGAVPGLGRSLLKATASTQENKKMLDTQKSILSSMLSFN